jgi:ribose 5-phosphate isomerase B
MKIAIAADHAGLELKDLLATHLSALGHTVLDMGTNSLDAVDYPDYAKAVGEAVQSGGARRGILVCGSGVGACVAANKIRGVRAAVCHDTYSARQGVEHDDMNLLCLGGRIIGANLAYELVNAFMGANFTNEERHVRRLNKVKAMEDSM